MTEDLIKEALPLEEQKQEYTKKQLYKNWKLYATALGIITIGLSVGLGVGLGTGAGHSSVLAKKDLNNLGLNTTIDLSPDTTISDVNQLFDKFLQDNQDAASDLKNGKNININSYLLPDWGTPGWIKITGTGNYKGTITIIFPAWEQKNLETFHHQSINGVIDMTEEDAFAAFLENNQDQDLSDLRNNVNLAFTPPTYNTDGLLVITAKANLKYIKSVAIKIEVIKGINLSDLDNTIISGIENMKVSDAFGAFLENNQDQDLSDLVDNVDLSFVPPKFERTGLLTISVNKTGKYSGTIELVISRWGQKDINGLNLNIDDIDGLENMTEEDAWNAFMENNQDQDLSDLRDSVDLIFTAPGYANNGLLTITSTADGNYSGKLSVVISALGQRDLSTLNLNLTLTDTITSQDDAFNQFLINNQEYPNLSDYVKVGLFTMPTYSADGKLVIVARTDIDNKYNGSVGVTINKIPQQDLADLILVTQYNFDSVVNQNDIFDQFIKLNQDLYPDLKDNLEIGTLNRINHTLEIKAKTNGKYYGSVIFNFTGELSKTDLNDLNLVNSLNDIFIVQDDAFEAFLKANSGITDLRDSVEVSEFINSKYDKNGSLVITAKSDSQYTGSITISLGKITIPLDLKKFDGYDAGDLEVTQDTESVIKGAIVNKIIDLAGPLPVDAGTISSAISIEINSSHTSALIKPQGLGSIAVRNQATVYFTIKLI